MKTAAILIGLIAATSALVAVTAREMQVQQYDAWELRAVGNEYHVYVVDTGLTAADCLAIPGGVRCAPAGQLNPR